MAMFDIKDSEDIKLDENKTSKKTLAKVENVKNLEATRNEAGVSSGQKKADEDVIEIKPNLWGMGINIRALWRKITSSKK